MCNWRYVRKQVHLNTEKYIIAVTVLGISLQIICNTWGLDILILSKASNGTHNDTQIFDGILLWLTLKVQNFIQDSGNKYFFILSFCFLAVKSKLNYCYDSKIDEFRLQMSYIIVSVYLNGICLVSDISELRHIFEFLWIVNK